MFMNEVEVKILEINPDSLRATLQKLGFAMAFKGNLFATYWDTSHKMLHRKRQSLRLRKQGDSQFLTFKKTTKGITKVANEIELKVSDYETCQLLLICLGFIEFARQEKHRESWTNGKVHVEIDTLEGIPSFAEVEATSEEECLRTVSELGFSLSDAKPWTGKEVINYYKRKAIPKNS